MGEPTARNGKTKAQLDDQIGRIERAFRSAVDRANDWDEMNRQRARWFRATEIHGRLRGDDRLIDSFKDYRPARRGFTSGEEIRRIERHFGLARRNFASLNALRNNIVEYYSERVERDARSAPDMEWLQSLTAVIDMYMNRL